MCRVLIVDDDKLIRWVLGKILAADGFDVVSAESAADVSSACDRETCLALLDYHLPDSTGVEVLRQLRENDADCQYVVMSADPSEEARAAALNAGAVDYVEKPADLTQMLPVVRRALEKRCAVRERGIFPCSKYFSAE